MARLPSDGKLDARISQDEIGLVYDKLAGIYDIWGNLTESRARARAIELAAIEDGQNILEVAVGTGLAFYEIVKRNPHGHNIGIDLSNGMLREAKADLQMKTESIDLLVNNYMFDLIPYQDMDKVLMEFKRVLKNGGKLILVNMTEGERPGSKLYDFIYSVSPAIMGGCRGVRMIAKLKQHGFRVQAREYYQQLLFPSEVILANK